MRIVRVGFAVAGVLAAGCGSGASPDCLALPCPMPLAIRIEVTSAAGGPVPGLALTATFGAGGRSSGPCTVSGDSSLCMVPGTAGTYEVQLTADGYRTEALSVTVEGTDPPCGCATATTRELSVVMTPL